jgi:hypothetical protein
MNDRRWVLVACILGMYIAACNGGGDAATSPDGSSGGGSGGSTAGTGPASVSFANEIEPILKSNCTSCHGGARPQSGIDLSTYAGVKGAASAANAAIQGGQMPPSGQLSGTDRQLFQNWVDQGAPNN